MVVVQVRSKKDIVTFAAVQVPAREVRVGKNVTDGVCQYCSSKGDWIVLEA